MLLYRAQQRFHLTNKSAAAIYRGFSRSRVVRDEYENEQSIPATSGSQSEVIGLTAKHALLKQRNKRRVSAMKALATKSERREQALHDVPRVATPAYSPHHDLTTFLDYAEDYKLKTNTTVFKGTLYEYTVAEALKAFNMSLKRVGKSDDRGIDLIGHWNLPDKPPSIRMLVQCKMTKTMPSLIRELEGSYAGGPTGWNSEDVFAVLASRHPASPGTQQAMQRSKYPLGFVQVDFDGLVRQFVWNSAANEAGLTGVGVTAKFDSRASKVEDQSKSELSIALTWLGEPWPMKPI